MQMLKGCHQKGIERKQQGARRHGNRSREPQGEEPPQEKAAKVQLDHGGDEQDEPGHHDQQGNFGVRGIGEKSVVSPKNGNEVEDDQHIDRSECQAGEQAPTEALRDKRASEPDSTGDGSIDRAPGHEGGIGTGLGEKLKEVVLLECGR